VSGIPWELVLGAIAGALVAGFGGFGWQQIKAHGRRAAEAEAAERERDAATETAERRGGPLPSSDDIRDASRDELERRGVRLDD
jgi:uncharacterized protein HemX